MIASLHNHHPMNLWEWRYSSIDGVEWSAAWPGHSTHRESVKYPLKFGWAPELV